MLKSDIATKTGGGLVHVVDRVLFPPTVGDVVETLQVSWIWLEIFLKVWCLGEVFVNYGSLISSDINMLT